MLLLDTHVLLWLLSGQEDKFSESALAILRDGKTEVFVSAATVWEIAIKKGLGKLKIPDGLEAALETIRFRILPISLQLAWAITGLPTHHADPIDRMLIAQATLEKLCLVTGDKAIHRYDVRWLDPMG
jgi:PIN domain nuclease of toxin-antitoxin system